MKASRIYAWVVVIVTVAIMAALIPTIDHFPPISKFLYWTILLAAVELLPVTLGFETRLTMGFTILLAIAILFQPVIAMLIAAIGSVDPREIRGEVPPHKALFNRAQGALATGAAAYPFTLSSNAFHPWLVVLAALAHLVVNLALVAAAVHFDQQIGIADALKLIFRDLITGFVVSYILLTGLGAATALAYQKIPNGEWVVIAILVPLLFARLSIQGAKAQQELSERLRRQQRTLLEVSEKVFVEREEERNRIAADIHDSSLQFLAAASYGVGNAKSFIEAGDPERAASMLTSAHDAIDRSMAAIRASLVDLRRSAVDEGGFMATIERLADEASTLWGTPVTIEGGVSKEPLVPVTIAALQIVQEAVTNSLKHSQSSEIAVRVTENDGMVHVVVEDFGSGFDTSAEISQDHVGMRLMQERASQVGGHVEMRSVLGSGTRIEAVLPAAVAS